MGRVTWPSAVPIRPLGVAEILDAAVRLVRGNGRAVLSVSVPLAVVRAGLSAAVQYSALASGDASTVALFGGLLLATGLGTVLTGLLAPLFSSDLLGTRLTAGESLRRVGRKAGPLCLLALVVTLVEGAGLIAFGVAGVWLWGAWAVCAPALVLERTGVRRALGRSLHLVQGMFWRVLGVRALGWVLTTVLGIFVALPFEALADYLTGADALDTSGASGNAALYVTLLSIGSLVSAAVLAPISSAVDVLLYTDVRIRREGMDIVLGLPPTPEPTGIGPAPVSAW